MRRVVGGSTRIVYEAACKCGWREEFEGLPAASRTLRIQAETAAVLHYIPALSDESTREFRQLLPACLSRHQVDTLLELVLGKQVQSPAATVRGAARGYRSSYQRAFAAFMRRLEGRGACIGVIPGPRGGLYAAYYRLNGLTLPMLESEVRDA